MASRDLTFRLEDMARATPGVLSVVHASTDGLLKHHHGLDLDSAQRQAALASALRASAMGVPAESVPALAHGGTGLDYLSFETPPTGPTPGTKTMLIQPAARALLLAVADDQCPAPVLAQALSMLGKQVAAWWDTAPRTPGIAGLAG